MDVKKFEYLTTIAECKTLSAASNVLFISQPSLSQFLNKTESELGVKLFKRINQEMIPTSIGKTYLNYCYQIIDLHKNAIAEIQDFLPNSSGEICIGFTPERGSLSLHHLYQQFHDLYPKIQMKFIEDAPTVLEEKVLKSKLDIALVSDVTCINKLEYMPLCRNVALLAINKTNPAIEGREEPLTSDPPYIDLHDLEDTEFVLTKRNTKTRIMLDSFFHKERFYPNIIFETEGARTSLNVVRVSSIATIIPSAYAETDPNIWYFRIPGNPSWNICAVTKQGRYMNLPLKNLVDIAKKHLQSSILVQK